MALINQVYRQTTEKLFSLKYSFSRNKAFPRALKVRGVPRLDQTVVFLMWKVS